MTDWRERADKINAMRVFPRIFVCTYLTFFIVAWVWVVWWFMHFDWNLLPKDQVVGAVAVAAIAGFPSIILGILTKILRELIQSYWNGQRPKYSQPGGGDAI